MSGLCVYAGQGNWAILAADAHNPFLFTGRWNRERGSISVMRNDF